MKIAVDLILISFIIFGFIFLKLRKRKKNDQGRRDKTQSENG